MASTRLTPHQAEVMKRINASTRLTPHQAEVMKRINARYFRSKRPVALTEVGSRQTCFHLERKGWITLEYSYGPRGGEIIHMTPVGHEDLLARSEAYWDGYFSEHSTARSGEPLTERRKATLSTDAIGTVRAPIAY